MRGHSHYANAAALVLLANSGTDGQPSPQHHVYLEEGDQFAKRVARAIRLLRLRRGWTQNQAAAVLSEVIGRSIDQSYVSKVEKSTKGVTIDRLGRFLRALGYDFGDLDEAMKALAKAGTVSPDDRLRELRELTK